MDLERRQVFCDDGLALDYDHLVVAVGAQPNTFGIPGVQQHARFMKEIEHGRAVRKDSPGAQRSLLPAREPPSAHGAHSAQRTTRSARRTTRSARRAAHKAQRTAHSTRRIAHGVWRATDSAQRSTQRTAHSARGAPAHGVRRATDSAQRAAHSARGAPAPPPRSASPPPETWQHTEV